MSRKIDLTQQLSKEDRAYLVSRARHNDLEWNRLYLQGEMDPEVPPFAPTPSQVLVGGDTSPNARSTTVQDVSVDIARQEGRIDAAPLEEEGDNYDDESAWSYRDLQAELKERELTATGERAELIERLREDDAS